MPRPFESLSHRRLLNLLDELEQLVVSDLALPALTSHLAVDLVDYLDLKRCRVLVPMNGSFRVAADVGWGHEEVGEAAHHVPMLSPNATGPLFFDCPDESRLGHLPDEDDDHQRIPHRRIFTPVRFAETIVAWIELREFDWDVELDDYTGGFIAALGDVLGRALSRRMVAAA